MSTGAAGIKVSVVFTAALGLVMPGILDSSLRCTRRWGQLAGLARGLRLGALVAVQFPLCVTLLAGAGLFLRTPGNYLDADL